MNLLKKEQESQCNELDRKQLKYPKPRKENNLKALPLVTTHNDRKLNNILKTDENMSQSILTVILIDSNQQPQT